jgi:hypothetical protein
MIVEVSYNHFSCTKTNIIKPTWTVDQLDKPVKLAHDLGKVSN